MSVINLARRRHAERFARRTRRLAVLSATETIAQRELLTSKLYRYDA